MPVCLRRILRPWQNTEPRSITNTTLCTKCGGAGHISSDCKYTRWGSVDQFPKFQLVSAVWSVIFVTFALLLCVAHSLPTEQQAGSLLSRPRTRLVWIRNICPSWLNWGRLRSPPLGEDTPAIREGLGLQVPTITSHHRLVGNTHDSKLCWWRNLSWMTADCLCAAEPASLDELWSDWEQELPWHAWRSRWPWGTSQLPSPHAQHGRPPYAPQPQWHASTLDAAPSSSHGPGSRTSRTPHG